jgi:hypothetical protein
VGEEEKVSFCVGGGGGIDAATRWVSFQQSILSRNFCIIHTRTETETVGSNANARNSIRIPEVSRLHPTILDQIQHVAAIIVLVIIVNWHT